MFWVLQSALNKVCACFWNFLSCSTNLVSDWWSITSELRACFCIAGCTLVLYFGFSMGWIYLVSFIFATYRWRLSPVFGILRLVLNLVNAGWPIARLLAALFRSLYDPLAQYGAPAVKPKRETRLQSLTDLFPVRRQHSRNQWMWWNQRQSFSQPTYVKYCLKPSQKVFLCQFYGSQIGDNHLNMGFTPHPFWNNVKKIAI